VDVYLDTGLQNEGKKTDMVFDQVPPSPFCRAGWVLNMELSEKARAGHARNLKKNSVYGRLVNVKGGVCNSTYRLRVTIMKPEISIPDELKPSVKKI
jgi:hypothetical protein